MKISIKRAIDLKTGIKVEADSRIRSLDGVGLVTREEATADGLVGSVMSSMRATISADRNICENLRSLQHSLQTRIFAANTCSVDVGGRSMSANELMSKISHLKDKINDLSIIMGLCSHRKTTDNIEKFAMSEGFQKMQGTDPDVEVRFHALGLEDRNKIQEEIKKLRNEIKEKEESRAAVNLLSTIELSDDEEELCREVGLI